MVHEGECYRVETAVQTVSGIVMIALLEKFFRIHLLQLLRRFCLPAAGYPEADSVYS